MHNDFPPAPKRNPQFAVDLDLPATVEAFEKGWHRVSWSKLKTFRQCQVSWFFENYAVPLEREVYSEDSAAAIPGTITQRVWEALINERVFLRYQTLAELHQWCAQQTAALFHAIVMPFEAQFEIPRTEVRKYFRTAAGKARLEHTTRQHGLEPIFYTGLQPKFTDLEKFADKHGSIEKFLAKLSAQYPTMLAKFAEKQVDLSKMLSEQFIRAKFGQYELAGGVDFLFNTTHMTQPFDKLSQLENGYIILDGKAQVHDKTPNGQLFFYATILFMTYRKTPSFVGFIDWSKSDFIWYPFKLEYIEQTKRAVSVMQATAFKLKEALVRLRESQDKLSVYELPFLEFGPDRMGCRFCGMSEVCESAVNAGYSRQKPADYIKPTKAVPEGIDLQNLSTPISEVSF